jgi:hypothetical protein
MSLHPGTLAPLLRVNATINPEFALGSLGGRYVVLAFLPPPGPEREAALALVREHSAQFADLSRLFFGVLPDAESFVTARDDDTFRWFGDMTGEMRRAFMANGPDGELEPQWIVLDPTLRILTHAPLAQGRMVLERLSALGRPEDHAGVPMHAPALMTPRIFDPDLCQRLIEVYNRDGGAPSGVMKQIGGKTVGVLDDFKSRRDATLTDPDLLNAVRQSISLRLLPQIVKVFQFKPTRIERYIVACYDAGEGGHFRPHRDNTTTGTAHRRFAVSINLNAGAYEGGDLRFPEFGPATYRPPPGGAVVFSCSLLHEATPVTKGTRYAFLPFLFDEDAERIRQANRHALTSVEAETAA